MSWDYEDDECRPNKKEHALLIKKRLSQIEEETGELLPALDSPKRGNLCKSFWGRNWCRHLEKFSAWEFRLPRGRSLLRNGSVYGAGIKEGLIHGYVAGADLYEASIIVAPISEELREELKKTAAESAFSLIDLWSGNLSDSLLEELTRPENGLFPRPGDIQVICHCTDWADICEHGAALLYGAGILFEKNPELLFQLRGISHEMIIPPETAGSHNLPEDELESLFDIEIE